MNKAVSLTYVILTLVLVTQFAATLWAKTQSVQHASMRTSLQQEIVQLQSTADALARQLSQREALSQTQVPEDFTLITQTVTVTKADKMLATR